MKYAVIADIHGNYPALCAAMKDAAENGADRFVFLGDYCVSAAWPDEVVDALRTKDEAVSILGNEESYLKIPDGDDGQFAISRWAGSQLSDVNRKWLDELPKEAELTDEGVRICAAHKSEAFIGSAEIMHFSMDRMEESAHRSGVIRRQDMLKEIRDVLTADESFSERIRQLEPGVYLFGHTHAQWHGWFEGRLLVNPGSCGLPLDGTGSGAPYTLLTINKGAVEVEERRAPYDVEELIRQVKASGQYAAAPVWSEVIFMEWRSGWEKIGYFLRFAEQYARKIGDSRRPFARDTWAAALKEWKKLKTTEEI